MKKPRVILLLMSVLLAVSVFFAIKWLINENGIGKEFRNEEEEEESGVKGQMMSWFTARAYPDPYYLNNKYMNGWYQAQAIRNQYAARQSQVQSGIWNSIGPNTGIGGRILTIAIDPANSNKLFAGSASGGIWKSINGGSSWLPVTTGFPVVGVSSIIINPSNSNVIYAGTGEVYRIDSTSGTPNPGNTGFSVWKTRGTYGIGILKSIDGGTTWTQVLNRNTSQLFAVQTLRFDPSSSTIIYAAATDGLYRSGDAGVSWTKILNLTYVSDVVINGANLVVAVGNLSNTVKGIFKSTNGGTSWAKITSGLPASFQGFIKMDCLPADPNTIVASIGVSETAGVSELYRSTNFGTSWAALSTSTHTSYQYWSAHDLAINPSNTNKILFGGVGWSSGDGIYSYTLPSSKSNIASNIHADVHDIQFDPSNANIVYVCCDGGIYKSTNGGSNFSTINTGLGAIQFYASLGVSATDPNFFVGGLQDNGQVYYNGTAWTVVSGVGGDGTACAVDPSNDNNVLVSRDARGIYRSTNKASSASSVATYWGSVADSRTAFAAPIAYSKSNSSIVYAGSDNLHKSTNGGSTWSNNSYSGATNYIDALHKTAITLAVSPTNPNKIYVSTSNFAQYDNDVDNLYVTGMPNILKSTTGNTPFASIKGSLPDRFVMDFAISPSFDDSVFVVLGGFGTSHVYVTGNGGTTWASRGVGLPDVPFNAIVFDPVNSKIIYAGCDLGVYASPDRGLTWVDYNNGFWDATMVADLQITADKKLLAATHGKGVFKTDLFSGSPLPVTLETFTGINKETFNELQWTISQETNLASYNVERSNDGVNFKEIARVSPLNSRGRASYMYKDAVGSSSAILNYYRLKCVDLDGSYFYSNVVLVRRASNEKFAILGNPFHDRVSIQFSVSPGEELRIELQDINGRLLRVATANTSDGNGVWSIDNLAAFPAGTYLLQLVTKKERKVYRLSKRG